MAKRVALSIQALVVEDYIFNSNISLLELSKKHGISRCKTQEIISLYFAKATINQSYLSKWTT